MSRLDRLGSAKSVAEMAAVIGREFSYELLVKIADLPEEHVKDELRRLVDAGLLVSGRSTAVLGYAFKHALVRDAAYANLLRKRQVALHARIARALIDDFPELAETQPEVVAYHLQAAGELDDAVDYLVRAAKLSARRSGFVEAIAHLDGALAILGKQPKSVARLRRELSVYRALGGIYAEHRGFSSEECGRAYTTALESCRELGDTPEIFAVLSGRRLVRDHARRLRPVSRRWRRSALTRAATQTVEAAVHHGPPAARRHVVSARRTRGRAHASRRGAAALRRRPRTAAGQAGALRAGSEVDGTVLPRADADDHGRRGPGCARRARPGLAHSRTLGGLHTINFSMCYLASVLYIRRPTRRLRCVARTESLESAREQGFATWIGISQVVRGAALVKTGQVEEGLAELGRGMDAHSGMQANAYQPFVLALWAEGLLTVGRDGEALDALNRASALSEAQGERFYAAEVWRLKAQALAKRGDHAEAKRCLNEAIEIARRQRRNSSNCGAWKLHGRCWREVGCGRTSPHSRVRAYPAPRSCAHTQRLARPVRLREEREGQYARSSRNQPERIP